ncbi:D-alanyl-D-alanine carboxypeptidase [Sporosarcina sp. P37]|uniref:D-alanyl-D-alanine carboxypeptidase family protein n=1 Tax=unclassified Sporosarcina TaxID=2647733 RepID=UPI000A17EE4A|nr:MULTISPECIES: D-alanyl-D-alanine carboxypeptidase family protein [unclassified Sporosarcina]ARK24907.1 D-alanyl-D-alanine carboxypeptidase [Sporosarcina sp. P37]PID17118.1 D-alanyl-D-alanine carboxypeptidase [Sporosarcina sp. P35]
MKKVTRRWLAALMVPMMLLMTFGVQSPAAAEEADEPSLELRVNGAILIDADSGKVLYEENADQPLGIASMTKMLTEYLMFEAIEDGTITWDQKYHVTDYTYKVSQDRRLSNVPLRRDGSYTIRELYEAVAIYSANAATIAIAESIAGTEEEFVSLMNEKADELGLTDYKFVNSTGLNNSDLQGMHPSNTGGKDENVMPARSVAKLAYHLLKEYPEVLDTTKISKKTFREGTSDAIDMMNWNFMLPDLAYEYPGIDGLKTGTTEFAGHCFTGTAVRDGRRVIAVVMNAVDEKGVGSYEARFDATRKLFDYGFDKFSETELLPAGHQFKKQKTLNVVKGKEKKVAIATNNPISLLVRNDEEKDYKTELVLDDKLVKNGQIQAPIEKGTVIGHVKLVKKDGSDYDFIDGKTAGAEVVATEDVQKAGWFSLTLGAIGNFFSNAWKSSTGFVKGLFE